MTIKTTSDKAAVVDSGYHWIPVSKGMHLNAQYSANVAMIQQLIKI